MHKKFKYRFWVPDSSDPINVRRRMDEFGDEGWELVTVLGPTFIFKRENWDPGLRRLDPPDTTESTSSSGAPGRASPPGAANDHASGTGAG